MVWELKYTHGVGSHFLVLINYHNYVYYYYLLDQAHQSLTLNEQPLHNYKKPIKILNSPEHAYEGGKGLNPHCPRAQKNNASDSLFCDFFPFPGQRSFLFLCPKSSTTFWTNDKWPININKYTLHSNITAEKAIGSARLYSCRLPQNMVLSTAVLDLARSHSSHRLAGGKFEISTNNFFNKSVCKIKLSYRDL